jgi:purine catabolism regulator
VSVHLEQLLAEPEFGLELVAGANGVATRGPIRWAHISEIPDPTPWLEGGELLLTTGLGVKDSPRQQRSLIAGLQRRGCVAVGFGVGIWRDQIPTAMVTEAEQRALPLFTVPYRVPFIAITKYVSSQVFAAHYAGLRRALDLHRRVLAVVTSSGGLAEVLAETARSVGDVDAVIFDSFGHVLASAGDTGRLVDHAALWRALPSVRSRTQTMVAGHVANVLPLRASDDVQAVMVVASGEPLDEARELLVQQGAAAATVELSRGLSVRKARRTSVAELLDDVMEGRASRQRLAHRLEQLGVDPSARYHVITILADDPRRASVLAGMLEDMAMTGAHAAVAADDSVIHAIVQPADAALGATLVAAARARGLPPPRVGRSRQQHDVDTLAVALRESTVAAERSGGGLLDVRDLGVEGLLAGVASDASADAFVTQMLGPVLAHDPEGDGALVASLRAYLRHGCRPGPAADELRVHRHTLAYRLDRVAQLTGRDPRSGEHLLPYGIALELLAQRDASSRGEGRP